MIQVYFSVTHGGFFNINVWATDSGDPEINLLFNDGVLSMDDFIENDDDGGAGLKQLYWKKSGYRRLSAAGQRV
ncbi:MAG: hypothetical protein KJ737_26730 [Proteobacteria bacterium]|nr:hypothetical protein [Pseudomonadota bacterium]